MKIVVQEWNRLCPTRMSHGRNVAALVACRVSLVRPDWSLTRGMRHAAAAPTRMSHGRNVAALVACRVSLVINHFSKAKQKEAMK